MLIVVISIFSIILTVFFLRPYMRTKSQRVRSLRWFLALIPLAIFAYWIVSYFTYYNKPESFAKGVELLQDDKGIQSKIGGYQSYSYFDKDLPKKTDNPASFKVSLKGLLATIYLSCKIKKDTSGKWHLMEIKQDSLIK